MKLLIKKSVKTSAAVFGPGESPEIDDREAQRLIASGHATAYPLAGTRFEADLVRVEKLDSEIKRMKVLDGELKAEIKEQIARVTGLSPIELQLPVSAQPGITGPTRQALQTIEDCRTKLSFIPDCTVRYQEALNKLRSEMFKALQGLCDEYAGHCRQKMDQIGRVEAQKAYSAGAEPSKVKQIADADAAGCRESAWLGFFELQLLDSNSVMRGLAINILDGIARFRAGEAHP